jgi:hypothetical protein
MGMRLVASSDGNALAIRDHLVPLVRKEGRIEVQRASVRLTTLRMGPWVIEHWTPFNDLEAGEASSPGYRHALERQHGVPDLPYGLDVWFSDAKVLSVIWGDHGPFEVIAFARGAWEEDALKL